jgi:5-methylthioadenosine/S-adenosylhomocysteine deaminase
MKSILIKGGTILTMDDHHAIARGDLLIRDGVIASIGETGQTADIVIDAADCAVLPGFIQTHIHLCQTSSRCLRAPPLQPCRDPRLFGLQP